MCWAQWYGIETIVFKIFNEINRNSIHIPRFDIANAKSKVIVVIKDEVPETEEMPRSLQVYIQKKTYLLSTDPNFYEKLRRAIPNKAKVLPKVQEFTNITCNDSYWNKLRSQKTKNQKCHMVFVSHQRKRGFVLFNFVVSGHIAIHLMQWL